MINKKLGISIPWQIRTNSFNIIIPDKLQYFIFNVFLKQNIFISDIYIQDYPKAVYILFQCFTLTPTQYKEIKPIICFLEKFLTILLKKNIYICCYTSKHIYSNLNIFINWLGLKWYNEPNQLKKTLKQILRQYDTITK